VQMKEFDNSQAFSEGWLIADCYGSDNGRWQLQKLDETDIFPDDQSAWRHVERTDSSGTITYRDSHDVPWVKA
jgi:hypothetical protein